MYIELKNYSITFKPFYGIGFGYFKQKIRNQRINSFVIFCVKLSYKENF